MSADMEQIDFEIEFFEKLVAGKNDFVDAMIPLADAYTKRGLYEKGYRLDLELSRLRPQDGGIVYNLACSEALLGKKEQALKSLRRAVELGYLDLVHLLKDRDLASLQNETGFLEIVNVLKDRLRRIRRKFPGGELSD